MLPMGPRRLKPKTRDVALQGVQQRTKNWELFDDKPYVTSSGDRWGFQLCNACPTLGFYVHIIIVKIDIICYLLKRYGKFKYRIKEDDWQIFDFDKKKLQAVKNFLFRKQIRYRKRYTKEDHIKW